VSRRDADTDAASAPPGVDRGLLAAGHHVRLLPEAGGLEVIHRPGSRLHAENLEQGSRNPAHLGRLHHRRADRPDPRPHDLPARQPLRPRPRRALHRDAGDGPLRPRDLGALGTDEHGVGAHALPAGVHGPRGRHHPPSSRASDHAPVAQDRRHHAAFSGGRRGFIAPEDPCLAALWDPSSCDEANGANDPGRRPPPGPTTFRGGDA
jgi:hypothetical protein